MIEKILKRNWLTLGGITILFMVFGWMQYHKKHMWNEASTEKSNNKTGNSRTGRIMGTHYYHK